MSDSKELLLLKKFRKTMKNQDNCETATAYISRALENIKKILISWNFVFYAIFYH